MGIYYLGIYEQGHALLPARHHWLRPPATLDQTACLMPVYGVYDAMASIRHASRVDPLVQNSFNAYYILITRIPDATYCSIYDTSSSEPMISPQPLVRLAKRSAT